VFAVRAAGVSVSGITGGAPAVISNSCASPKERAETGTAVSVAVRAGNPGKRGFFPRKEGSLPGAYFCCARSCLSWPAAQSV
jgi:hypothetical protein